MGFTLASASDVVHIWEIDVGAAAERGATGASAVPQLTPPAYATKTINAHSQAVHAIQWNHNNSVLVSGSADGSIGLSGVGDGKLLMRLPQGGGSSGPRVNAIGFSSGSRYLVSGAGAVLALWDLKHPERAARRLLGHTSEISALDLGAGDALVASCGTAGEILLHNLAQASLSSKLASDGQPLSDVQFSSHRPNLLASVGEAGTVQVWDTAASSLHATLRPSTSVSGASGGGLVALRFSTTSPSLLASVGQKRLCFYDVASKKCIRDIATDYALTSLDYHWDGCSLAIGTEAGHVLMYDIRAASKPTTKILNAHAGKFVHAVKFQNTVATRKPNATSAASAASVAPPPPVQTNAPKMTTPPAPSPVVSTPVVRTAPAPAAAQPPAVAPAAALNGSSPNSSLANHTAPAGQHGLFSPIKSSATSPFANTTIPRGGERSVGHSFHSPTGAAANTTTTTTGFSADPSLMLTPIAHERPAHLHARLAQPTTTIASTLAHAQPPSHLLSTFMRPSALAQQAHPPPPSMVPQPAHLSMSPPRRPAAVNVNLGDNSANNTIHTIAGISEINTSATSTRSVGNNINSSSSFSPENRIITAATAAAAPPSGTRTPPRRAIDTTPTDSARPENMQLVPSPRRHYSASGAAAASASAAASSSSVPSSPSIGASAAGLNDFQVALLRSMLDESLYAMRSEFRAQLTDMHMEMIKQFHSAQVQQQRALDTLTDRFQAMVDEVRELRQDYKELRHIY